ncbi:heavy metal sensor histidine kinase [Pusillimonas sp. TS35]|uniref:Cu(+)/Ag(+) sensor histidine kinase n=1 Tax=Paracandidimonas lactea TaxID=2895524 RepID=UPI00136B1B12|nr:Cu(+)/Ag(+) sensor histidine kinase [Paracandidimonas lactea]MYN13076.1 heavy metal sensor histidine kinase [Pusillimonas sp. TS35]
MRRPASLAVRLTVSIGAVITVVLLAFGWLIQRSINNHFIKQDVDELNAVVQAVAHALAVAPPNEPEAALSRRLAGAVSGHHNALFRLATDTGEALYATPGVDLEPLARSAPVTAHITTGTVRIWRNAGQTYRGAVTAVPVGPPSSGHTYIITVVTGIDFHLHYLDSFRAYLWITTMVACLIAIAATWLAVYRGHAPIRRISREMRRIGSSRLYIRLRPAEVPAELAELANSFNGMLDRLENVFQRLSAFSGDIAHELRTPITNLKTQTEVALSQARTVEHYREILYSNLEEYERMAKMVGDMLFLAEADNNLLKPELATIDLADEVRALFDYFDAWAEERGVHLALSGASVQIEGDRLMMRRALGNLLSNAVRHTPRGESVAVTLRALDDNHVGITVTNPGAGIAPEHLPHIFERFYRPDASRQRGGEGAGLGLAIVKSIIEAHAGTISASSDPIRTCFTIRLPAARPRTAQGATVSAML